MKTNLLLTALAFASVGLASASVSEQVRLGVEQPVLMENMAKNMKVRNAQLLPALKPTKYVQPVTAASDLTALYDVPAGAYFVGLDVLTYSSSQPQVLVPPFVDMQWNNYSSEASKSFEWEYGIGDMSQAGGDTYFDDAVHLTTNYKMTYSSMPKLTVSDGTNTASYQLGFENEGEFYSGVVNSVGYGLSYDESTWAGVSPQIFTEGITTFRATDTDTWFGKNSTTLGQGITGYGLLVPAPTAPFSVQFLYTFALSFDVDDDATLKMDVKSVGADGSLGDVIATAYCKGSEAQNIGDASNPFYVLPFYFMAEDDMGFLSPTTFVLDQTVYIEFSSFMSDSKVRTLEFPVSNNLTPDVPMNLGYIMLEQGMLPISQMFEGDPNYTAPAFFMAGLYPAIKYAEESCVVPTAGGEKVVDYQSNFMITDETATITCEDWFTCSFDNDKEQLTITASEMPQGTTSRSGKLTVDLFGITFELPVVQGEASVEGVETSAVVVSVVDGNFVVKGSNASMVDVYNVAGQKVASAAVDGETVVNAENLAKGMYILKFNDNTAIKVVK